LERLSSLPYIAKEELATRRKGRTLIFKKDGHDDEKPPTQHVRGKEHRRRTPIGQPMYAKNAFFQ